MKKTSFVALAIVGLSLAFMLTGCSSRSDVVTITIFNNTVEPYHFWVEDGKCSAMNKVEPGSNITIRKWKLFETSLIDGLMHAKVSVHVGQDGNEVKWENVLFNYPTKFDIFTMTWNGTAFEY